MTNRLKAKSSSGSQVSLGPKTFSPQEKDSLSPNAWDSFDQLAQRPKPGRIDPETLAAMARTTIRARVLRARFLPPVLFGEPAWDMLLTLYAEARSGARLTVSNLSDCSGAPPTTALRWIDHLEKLGFVERKSNPTDRRVVFVDLTDKARTTVETYFLALAAERILLPN